MDLMPKLKKNIQFSNNLLIYILIILFIYLNLIYIYIYIYIYILNTILIEDTNRPLKKSQTYTYINSCEGPQKIQYK